MDIALEHNAHGMHEDQSGGHGGGGEVSAKPRGKTEEHFGLARGRGRIEEMLGIEAGMTWG